MAAQDTLNTHGRARMSFAKQADIDEFVVMLEKYERGEITPEMRRLIPLPAAEHPLVKTMPYGRKALYVGGHCTGIAGMGDAEARALIHGMPAEEWKTKYQTPATPEQMARMDESMKRNAADH